MFSNVNRQLNFTDENVIFAFLVNMLAKFHVEDIQSIVTNCLSRPANAITVNVYDLQ